MEDLTIRRRNRLRHHYTLTSNVLLFGYSGLSDPAKLTYQVIDSFDWNDSAGLRKGFAYPSLGRLAAIRGVDKRSIRRHLAQLEQVGLVTRQKRPGRPSLLVIEDPSPRETQAYLRTYAGEDKVVLPTPDNNVRPYKEEEEKERQNNVNAFRLIEDQEECKPWKPVGETVMEWANRFKPKSKLNSIDRAKRDHLAQEMLDVLGDKHSLGCYRRIAEQCLPNAVYEALARVKETARNGMVKRSKGALFVYLMQRMTDETR